jgi:hypothetical protein
VLPGIDIAGLAVFVAVGVESEAVGVEAAEIEVVVVGKVAAELFVVEATVPERFDSRRRRLVSSSVKVVAVVPATAASVNAAVVSDTPPHPALISASATDVAIRLIRKTGLLWLIRYSLIQ